MARLQLFEGQVELVAPPVSLGQIDKRLVGLGLELDRGFQVGDGVVDAVGPDAQNAAIDEKHIPSVVIKGHLRGLLEVGIRRSPRLQLLLGEAAQEIQPDKIGALARGRRSRGPGPRRAAAAAAGRAHSDTAPRNGPACARAPGRIPWIAASNCSRRYSSSAIRK